MSTLSYFVSQLDQLDPQLYKPLNNITWQRDIYLRSDVAMANESTSFNRTTFGGVGGQSATGKSWIASNGNTLPDVSVNGERIVKPMRLLGRTLSYTSVELERSIMLKSPIDVSKFNALNEMYQMEIDEMVYVGDSDFSVKGLVNSAEVASGSVANGALASPLWVNKTVDEKLKDINECLNAAHANSGYSVYPSKLLLPPAQMAQLTVPVTTGGSKSALLYIKENSLCMTYNGVELDIQSSKFLTGRGAGGTDRMVAYTNNQRFIRFPMVPIRPEVRYNQGISFYAPYIWSFGEVEFVYPETIIYRDGI